MQRRGWFVAGVGVLALTLRSVPGLASDLCDRTCLEGVVEKYLAALVAHDPSRLPLAVNVRFTENGQELHLGDGLWGTTSGLGKYQLYVADPAPSSSRSTRARSIKWRP